MAKGVTNVTRKQFRDLIISLLGIEIKKSRSALKLSGSFLLLDRFVRYLIPNRIGFPNPTNQTQKRRLFPLYPPDLESRRPPPPPLPPSVRGRASLTFNVCPFSSVPFKPVMAA